MILPKMTGAKWELSQQDVDLTTETLVFPGRMGSYRSRLRENYPAKMCFLWGDLRKHLRDIRGWSVGFPLHNSVESLDLGILPQQNLGIKVTM
jgi:hypothetical protein